MVCGVIADGSVVEVEMHTVDSRTSLGPVPLDLVVDLVLTARSTFVLPNFCPNWDITSGCTPYCPSCINYPDHCAIGPSRQGSCFYLLNIGGPT